MNNAGVPQLKIYNFKKVNRFGERIDVFRSETIDGQRIRLDVRQGADGQKYFIIQSTFQVYGWTTDAYKAFAAFNRMGVFTCNEFYDALRGKTIIPG